MTKPIPSRQIEVEAVSFRLPHLYIDFSVDGFPAHAEIPYSHFIYWLHDHPDGPTFEAHHSNSRPRISSRGRYSGEDECTFYKYMKYTDGSEDNIPLRRTLKEVAEDWADMLPAFLREAIEDRELSRFIVSLHEAYEALEDDNYHPE